MKAKLILTAAVVTALCGFTAAATIASFSAETTNPTNKFATGTLVLSNKVASGSVCYSTGGGSTDTNVNNSCDNIFSLTAKKPGDTTGANLTLKNEGSINASALSMYTSACTDADAAGENYHGTGSPCGKVQLTVQQWTDNTFTTPLACIYGGTTVANTCDWSDTTKTIGAFATAHNGTGNAQTIGSGLNSGSSTYFTVSVKLPSNADNTFQGRSATLNLTWHIDQ